MIASDSLANSRGRMKATDKIAQVRGHLGCCGEKLWAGSSHVNEWEIGLMLWLQVLMYRCISSLDMLIRIGMLL